MKRDPHRRPHGLFVSVISFALLGWACATGEVGPNPEGSAGNGSAGTTAAAGTSGSTGDAGTSGAAGTVGTTGSAGTTGAAGTNATAGTTGTTGTAGTNGTAGTTGAAGNVGTVGGAGGTTGSGGGAAGRGGTTGAAGAAGRGGTTGAAGRGGTTGSAGRGGTTGTAGTTGTTGTGGGVSSTLCNWPTATGSQSVSSTINVSGTYDGGMKRFTGSGNLGGSGQNEGQPPMFQLSSGATLQNVIIGNPAADGVHCNGTCTLKNVWWEDVGEDAATLNGSSSSQVMTIDTGGAKAAADKVFQHDGAGTMIIRNFCVQDFGKLYRSCGNCSQQYTRHVEIDNVMAEPKLGPLAGVNTNYNDTAKFTRILIKASSGTICERYTGNNTGAEPVKTGSGADGTNCIYSSSDITYMP